MNYKPSTYCLYLLLGVCASKLNIMNEYDVKRLIEAFAIEAEIEAMKIANKQRDLPSEAPAYDENDFFEKAEELRILASKHNEQL